MKVSIGIETRPPSLNLFFAFIDTGPGLNFWNKNQRNFQPISKIPSEQLYLTKQDLYDMLQKYSHWDISVSEYENDIDCQRIIRNTLHELKNWDDFCLEGAL